MSFAVGMNQVPLGGRPVSLDGEVSTEQLSRTNSGASRLSLLDRSLSGADCCTSYASTNSRNVTFQSDGRSTRRSFLSVQRHAAELKRRQMACHATMITNDETSQVTMDRLESPSFSSPPFTLDSTPYSVDMGVGGLFATQVGAQVLTAVAPYRPKLVWFAKSEEEERKMVDRGINGAIVGFAAAVAATKIFTVDHYVWSGWTLSEIIRNVPRHNWLAYEAMLNHNPVLAKMTISGTVYTIGDWSAQCYEGRGVLDFDRGRMLRSGLVGFGLHGSLSHHYYHFCEWLFPSKELWVVPVKVLFDQTVWSAIWNSIYYVSLGLLRFENPSNIVRELKASFFPLLTAGWKLWPFAHIVTYGFMPVEQRLLWVDAVELVWVTILSMISNEKAEERRTDEENDAAVAEEFAQTAAGLAVLSEGNEHLLETILWEEHAEEHRGGAMH